MVMLGKNLKLKHYVEVMGRAIECKKVSEAVLLALGFCFYLFLFSFV